MLDNLSLKIHLQWQRFTYAVLLIFWIFRFEEGVWFCDLLKSPFIQVKGDFVYWILHLCHIPQYILSHAYLAYSLDLLLLLGWGFLILRPANKLLAYGTTLAYFLYVVTYNSSTLHHTHSLLPCLFMSIVLCFKSEKNYTWAMVFLRLYACFIMASAALWKIARTSAFHLEQMSNILLEQHATYLIENPYTFKTSILNFLIENPLYSYTLWLGAILIELFFLVGFFTKRFDWILLILLSVFVIGDYFLMNLYFWEFLVLCITFFRRQHAPYPLSQKKISNSL